MNQIYPKRLIHFISICLLILAAIVLFKQTSYFYKTHSNLTLIDKYLLAVDILYLLLVLFSTIAIFKKKKWAWVGIASFALYSIGTFFYEGYELVTDYSLIIVVPLMIVWIIATLFLFSKPVLNYLQVNIKYLFVPFIVPIILYNIASINPITNTGRVNWLYLEWKNRGFYIGDTLHTGEMFFNHPNGNREFEGKVKNGLEEGEWKYFYENGNLQSVTNYKNGLAEGKAIIYYSSGKKREEHNYINGELNGNYELWFPSGKIDIKGNYEKGLKQGEWKNYELSSPVIQVEVFNKDTLERLYYIE